MLDTGGIIVCEGPMQAGVATSPVSGAVDLVSAALRQERLSGIVEMLRNIAGQMEASGCILWHAVPGEPLTPAP